MRVKIQYSTDFENIPREVSRISQEAKTMLEQCADIQLDVDNPTSFIENVQELRKKLYAADSQLEDCVVLFSEYAKALVSMNSAPAPPPEPVANTELES
jgi:hypothetical protein